MPTPSSTPADPSSPPANETPAPRIVLGIDPGLGITGYGALRVTGQKIQLVEAGVVRPPSGKDNELAVRLNALFTDLDEVIGDVKPDVMVVEEIFVHVKFPKTAIIMGHARGVLLLAAARHGVPVHEYAPARIKMSVTGHGRADKGAVARSVASVLGMDKPPSPADVTDALAVALCHANQWAKPWSAG